MDIPDEELWAVRSALRHHLFAFIRERARAALVGGAGGRRPRRSPQVRCSTTTC